MATLEFPQPNNGELTLEQRLEKMDEKLDTLLAQSSEFKVRGEYFASEQKKHSDEISKLNVKVGDLETQMVRREGDGAKIEDLDRRVGEIEQQKSNRDAQERLIGRLGNALWALAAMAAGWLAKYFFGGKH